MKNSTSIRVAWLAAAAAIIAIFSLMGIWTVRMAWADYRFRQQTAEGTQAALRLQPDSAGYYVRLAALIQETNPAASTQALERAVDLNPWDSQSWVELGLRAEASGNLAGAERNLLHAARVDKQYLPAWSLVNYYFRRENSPQFWFWARQATRMAYDNLTPLFALCWKLSGDGVLIDKELALQQADQEAGYLTYLTNQNLIEPMAWAATRLLAWNREADTPVLLAACDRLIVDDRAAEATRIWNQLAQLRRIPNGALAPASGKSLTDGDFTIPPISQGFAWRLPDIGGVATMLDERPAGLRISFSGRQPENCDVLSQILPVTGGANYKLQFRYSTTGIAPDTGLGWRIMDLAGSGTLAQGESLASETEREATFAFTTPACARLVRLTLNYRRALGTTRIEGFIVLRKLRLAQAGNGLHEICKAAR